MKEYNIIKNKIEKIFNQLKISYKYMEMDEDINYVITFNTYGRLKSLDSIRGFVYFRNSDFSMNFIVLNIYTLDDDNFHMDTLDIYEIVNEINSSLFSGSFLVEENKYIFYRSSMICGHNYEGLNEQVVKRQIDIFTEGLNKLFTLIKSKG